MKRKGTKCFALVFAMLMMVMTNCMITAHAGTGFCRHTNGTKEVGEYCYTSYESHHFQIGGVDYICSITVNHNKVKTVCVDCCEVFDERMEEARIHTNRSCPMWE